MDRRAKALLALGIAVPLPSLGVLFSMVLAPGPVGAAVWTASKVLFFGLPLFWRLRVDRERASLSPLRNGGLGAGLWTGLLLGAAIAAFWFLAGRHWIDGARLRELALENGIGERAPYLAMAAYVVVCNSLLEEYAWRWFVYTRFETLLAPRAAAVAAALAFTAHHTILMWAQFGASFALFGSLAVCAGGLFWSLLYARYRSIRPGWLSHALVDVALLAIGWRLIFGG